MKRLFNLDYVDESLLCYDTLCTRLMEAEIEANEVEGRR
jgi:hypothetical protein